MPRIVPKPEDRINWCEQTPHPRLKTRRGGGALTRNRRYNHDADGRIGRQPSQKRGTTVKRIWSYFALVGMAVSVGACGAPQQKESSEQVARQLQGNAEQMGKALESLAKGLSGDGPNEPVDPAGVRDLQSVLPAQLAGWERGTPEGERMTQPVSFSEASVVFTKGDASLTVKITDTGFNQLLIAPYAMFLAAGYEKQTADGFEKATKVGDAPAWTKWNATDRAGELNVVVGNRFLVQIEGQGLTDEKILSQLATATNLKKLSELR